MKTFKKRGFWVLFGFVVLVGAFFIINSGLKDQSPVIPNVDAQMGGSYLGSSYGGQGGYGMMPSDIIFGSFSPITQYGIGYSPSGMGNAYTFAGDVAFGTGGHPGSIIFPADIHPGSIIIGRSNGKTEMRTIMTCLEGGITTTTCDWRCGPTFAYCNTGNVSGAGLTGLTCPGPTGLGWGNTNMACPTDIICGIGGNTNIACPTSIMCGIGGNTSMSCSTNLSGCGQTALFCPRRQTLYGGELGLYGYGGLGSMTAAGVCGAYLYGGIAPNPSPAF